MPRTKNEIVSRSSKGNACVGSHGVQFRDLQHKKQYKEMERRGIFLGRTLDLSFLKTLGLFDEIVRWIGNLKWESLVSIRYDGYRHLIYEFFSSLEVFETATGSYPANTMLFRLKNHDCLVKPEELAQWLGFDCEGLGNVPTTWSSQQAWTDVSGIERYHPHYSKSTKLTNPAMRLLHRFITYTFNARKNTNGNVTNKDLVLMQAAILGRQVNSAVWLIKKLGDIKLETGEIGLGMFITFFCHKLGFEITPEDETNKIAFCANNLLGDVTLSKMLMIKKNRVGEWYVIGDEMEEDAPVQVDVPGEQEENQLESSLRSRRRTKVEVGSSLDVEEPSSHTLEDVVNRLERIEQNFDMFAVKIEEQLEIMGDRMNDLFSLIQRSQSCSSNQPPPPSKS